MRGLESRSGVNQLLTQSLINSSPTKEPNMSNIAFWNQSVVLANIEKFNPNYVKPPFQEPEEGGC